MSAPAVVHALCRLPSYLRETRVSRIRALENSGYLLNPEAATEDIIEQHLRSYPELIEQWLMESGDQRCSAGWYLLSPSESQSRRWVIGYYPEGIFCECDDAFRAGAIFIKRYAENLAGFSRNRHKG